MFYNFVGSFVGAKHPTKSSGLRMFRGALLGTLKMHKGPQTTLFVVFLKFEGFWVGAKKTPKNQVVV